MNHIVDNRTEPKKLDKVQACGYCLISRGAWTGPAYWLVNDTSACDGCILYIASERNGEWLLPALVDIADRYQGQMTKLETPIPCEMHLLAQEEQRCTGLAHWRASGFAECDECIVNNLERHPDSREVLAPALDDIRERYLKVGARVRIQCASSEIGQLGTIYKPNKNDDAWYVRSDRTSASEPGLLCLPEELDVLL